MAIYKLPINRFLRPSMFSNPQAITIVIIIVVVIIIIIIIITIIITIGAMLYNPPSFGQMEEEDTSDMKAPMLIFNYLLPC